MIYEPKDAGKGANVPPVTKVTIRCPALEGGEGHEEAFDRCGGNVDVTVEGTDETGLQIVSVGCCTTGHAATVEEPTPWNGGSFSYEAVQQMLDEGKYKEAA